MTGEMEMTETTMSNGSQSQKIRASKCEVLQIEKDIAEEFIEENHRQGKIFDQNSYFCGLIYNDEIVAVMQFCSVRTSGMKKRYTQELVRFCVKKNYSISGAAGKLIKFYIESKNPADFFTYQDTTGLNTDVYEKAGMSFVRQEKIKQYLVAPGKTLSTGNRKEILGVPYAVRFGPDRILGTNLGEVFKEDGIRKSNQELFTEELGWHIETTTGDKVFEWINPNLTFYVYKITATDSNKYYYGVSHVKIANASKREIEIVDADYTGSGGDNSNNKFNNWKKKHKKHLQKEIIKTFSRKAEAYALEEELIGDKWQTDPLCLNSIAGGLHGGIGNTSTLISVKTCEIHGDTKHIGNSCYACTAKKTNIEKICEIHGLTKHQGNTCGKCSSENTITIKFCETHGETKHQGNKCRKCLNNNLITIKFCETHGMTKFSGNTCLKDVAANIHATKYCKIHGDVVHVNDKCRSCLNEKNISIKNCDTHGETKYIGDTCYLCINEDKVYFKECPEHGYVKHHGETCYNCESEKGITIDTCEIHGETSFFWSKCRKCHSDNMHYEDECLTHGMVKFKNDKCTVCSVKEFIPVTIELCEIHGETKHQSNKCCKCMNDSNLSLKFCETHGETWFIGDVCRKDIAADVFTRRNCKKHGETVFNGRRCCKCQAEKSLSIKECEKHGLQKHQGDACCKCRVEKMYTIQNCDKHGETTFRGKSCQKCTSEKVEAAKTRNRALKLQQQQQ